MIKTIKVTPIQKQALRALITKPNQGIREVLFGGAKSGGKSFLGAIYVNCNAILYEDTAYFIARYNRKDLIDYTIPTIYKFYKENGLRLEDFAKYNGQYNTFHFKNGSRIHLIDAAKLPSDPMFERFGSMEMTAGWLEEAGEQDYLAYENLKLSIGRQNNSHKDGYIVPSLLITCNPKKNWLYTDFYKPWRAGALPENKNFIKSLVTDNTFRAEGYEKTLDNIKSTRDYQRLRLGEWEYDDDDDCLINSENIENLYTNTFAEHGQRFMSCDVALLNDRFVVYVWDGLRIIDIVIYRGIKADDLCQKLEQLAQKHIVPRSNIIYDADGIGSYLRGYFPGAVPFNNNARAGLPEYPNIKTQLYYMLADYVNENKIYIEANVSRDFKEQLSEELQMIKKVESDRQLQIIPKSKVKELIGRSPDLTDAMMFRLYFVLTQVKPLRIR